MSGKDQARQLLDQLARTFDFPGLQFDEDGTLILQFQGGVVVFVGIDAAETHLTFLTSLTGSTGPKSTDFLQSLLQANFLWEETNGATLGIDGENGPVTLQKRYRIADLTYQLFESELNGFADVAFAWTQKVALAGISDKAGEMDTSDEPYNDDANSWMRA